MNVKFRWQIRLLKDAYLLAAEFNLEIFGRLLCDPSAKVQLIDLAIFVPHGRFVVHNELTSQDDRLRNARHTVRLDFSAFQLRGSPD